LPLLRILGKQERFKGPLDKMLREAEETYRQKMDEEFDRITNETKGTPMSPDSYYSYGDGELPSVEDVLGTSLENSDRGFKAGGLATPLFAGGGMTRYGKFAGGGLNIVQHAGKHRVDFRKGDAVTGPGDGQSDDIPAMLADGEFVIPADVVAALGNGSTKAGSDALYEMMHSIRARARKGHPKNLPPPAMSPLDYIKRRK
jgi:hypothetical protein